jgi:hypothetical protein
MLPKHHQRLHIGNAWLRKVLGGVIWRLLKGAEFYEVNLLLKNRVRRLISGVEAGVGRSYWRIGMENHGHRHRYAHTRRLSAQGPKRDLHSGQVIRSEHPGGNWLPSIGVMYGSPSTCRSGVVTPRSLPSPSRSRNHRRRALESSLLAKCAVAL